MSTSRLVARMMALLAISIIGCQSIVGIEQRHYDAVVSNEAGTTVEAGTIAEAGTTVEAGGALCTQYCNDLLRVCTGTNTPYSTRAACLAACALLPPGDPSEPSNGNSIACRQRQIALAELGEPSVSCPRAGPGGDGTCGSNCESYCFLFNAACGALIKPLPNCKEACGVLKDTKTFDVVVNHDGDTLQCRLVHVSNATANPMEHCPHAKVLPVTHPCDNPQEGAPHCEDYCRIVSGACSGANAVYESVDQCMRVCAVLPPGQEKDTAIDTVGCRKYHSYNSLGDPPTHCSHAGPGGDGHCGTDNCPAYCAIVGAACPAQLTSAFGDAATCLTECKKMKGSAGNSGFSTGAANGNTFQCRLLHSMRAFATPAACLSAVGAADCQ